MTALAYALHAGPSTRATDDQTLHCGGGVDLYTSGSSALASDMMTGGHTGLFTTSCSQTGQAMATGDRVELFTTSC